MHKPVSDADQGSPRRIGEFGARLGGYPARGFTGDLDGPDQREQQQIVEIKIGALAASSKSDG
jgi:hypothetical protein